MAPQTLLGLMLGAAALGPGYLFVRLGARHRARTTQSALAETVEMLAIGGICSVAAAGLVLSVGDWRGCLDTNAIASDVGTYSVTEPVRTFLALGLFYGLAYLFAWLASLKVHGRKKKGTINPVGNSWTDAMAPAAIVTVELRDERLVSGIAAGWTVEFADNRELLLKGRPEKKQAIHVAQRRGAPAKAVSDRALLLREQDIRAIWVR